MFENDILEQIKTLKQIKPREEWVVFCKNQILSCRDNIPVKRYRDNFSIVFNWKPILAGTMALAVLTGIFVLSQNSLPGEMLYSVKKASERGRVFLVSEQNKPRVKLALANKRLQELTLLAERDGEEEPEKLASAVSEFQASIAEAARNLGKIEVNVSSERPMMKDIVEQTKKLEENKEKAEALGVQIGATAELDQAIAQIVQREIGDLETRTLSEAQEQTLAELKQDYEAGNYSQALEKILLLSYPQDR